MCSSSPPGCQGLPSVGERLPQENRLCKYGIGKCRELNDFRSLIFFQALVKGGQQIRIGSKCLSSSMRGLLLILLGCHCSLIATFSFKQAPKNSVTGKHIFESSKHHLRFSVPAVPFVTKKGKYPTISPPPKYYCNSNHYIFCKKKI